MEASCFFTSKSFNNKTLDLVPSLKTRVFISHSKKRPTLSLNGNGGPSTAIACCSLRSSLPDDSREPSTEYDWRSFRARLVAGEQARPTADSPSPDIAADHQIPAPAVLSSDKWAHRLHEPEKGCLLIATDKLDGVHIFERTVILLLSTGPVGATGIILNRPSLMSIKETRSTDLDIAGTFSDRPLFFGGPLENGLFLLSAGGKEEEDGVWRTGVFEEVMTGLYYGTKESVGCAAEMVKRDAVGVGDLRFFDGYCGWERKQLKEEIRDGYWGVVACSPSVISLASVASNGLWDDILGLVGERKVW